MGGMYAPIEQKLRQHGYVPLPRFVIIDEHTHVRQDGRGVEHFDRARLERLAQKLNYKAEVKNSPLPAAVGHTRPGQPEHMQPKVAGYCTHYTVEPFERDPQTGQVKYAIWAQPWSRPDKIQEFKDHPHRSIELWTGGPDGDDIHPLALLGSTAPRRDLGVHMFNREGTPGQYHYSREVFAMDNFGGYAGGFGNYGGTMTAPQPPSGAMQGLKVGDMTIDQLAGALAPALAKSAEFSGLFQMQDELAGLLNDSNEFEPGGMGQPGQMGGMPTGGMPQGGMPGGMGGMPGGGFPGPAPEALSMGGFSAPGAMQRPQTYYQRGLFGPQPTQYERDPYNPTPAPAPTHYQQPVQAQLPYQLGTPSDPYFAHFQRLEQLILAQAQATAQALQAIAPTVTQYQKESETAKVDAELAKLAGERIRFDHAQERDYILKHVPEAARPEYFARIRANYGRLEPLPGQLPPGYVQLGQAPNFPGTTGGYPVPLHQQVPSPVPEPMHGHQISVGAVAPQMTQFQRQGGVPSAPATDEAAMPGMDPFTTAAAAQQMRMTVPQYLQAMRTGAGLNGQARPEQVR